ncbi:hypothetical protein MINTM011_22390 [Mycobacterium paraintracellulare]|nr:hypothetical protein MINTM011_22390 [Mycobacterium paraintracellulare]
MPPPEALTDVLARLADPNVPGDAKVSLVEGATPESAASLDKFTNALRDNGYLPMTFAANDIAWSDKNPSNVQASVAVHTAQANNANFTFPMEFAPFQGGWQLSRHTAETLLALGKSPARHRLPNPLRPKTRRADAPDVDRLARVRRVAGRRSLAQTEAIGRASRRRRIAAQVQRLGGRDGLARVVSTGRHRGRPGNG